MNYKLISIDVDDTLLNDEGIITEGTRQALAAAAERGVIVTLATGRMYASAKQIARQLDLNVPLITYQGALVKHLRDGKVLYERNVPEETARFLFEYSQEHGLHIQWYAEDTLYTTEDNEKVRQYARVSNVPYTVRPDLGETAGRGYTKVIFIDEPDTLDRITPTLQAKLGDDIHITKSKPYFLEFMHKEGSKGHALAHLCNHYGCLPDEAIAVGDSWNDRDMIAMAGLGVAMGNAVDELKALADFITASNNDEGVRHVVEQFILA